SFRKQQREAVPPSYRKAYMAMKSYEDD
ncbi:pilus assembly protein, partial [Salmonella enterica]|nr:pilus assembly protein [Salmonella enterica]